MYLVKVSLLDWAVQVPTISKVGRGFGLGLGLGLGRGLKRSKVHLTNKIGRAHV